MGEPPQLVMYASWDFQLSDDLRTMLAREFPKRYCEYQRDKVHMQTYLFLAGAGTGKSRNANEFHMSVLNSLSEHTALRVHVANAWVFRISFENGSSVEIGITAIGTRMLCALSMSCSKFGSVINDYEAPIHLIFFELIVRKNYTIFLVVDGLNQLMTKQSDGTDKNSDFYRTPQI
ncbi:1837_t:CDS:1 [Funneliformis mosseae]|uniref:1837_t:CDS:1 n=1 Tax=Funneliformis mosseae TaxID=27381 RepID=A0A9N8VXC2_FUNMO|nr:1837_t:CDS:1 [Funneliformis mosseae]